MSGTAIAINGARPDITVWGAEPAGADDAHRSLRDRGNAQDATDDSLVREAPQVGQILPDHVLLLGPGEVNGLDTDHAGKAVLADPP